MKYYKYVSGSYPSFTLGKIYPEDSYGEGPANYPIRYYVDEKGHFQEVSEEEYLKEENKMKKPYENVRDVTYYMITTHPYFKTLELDELGEIINYMNYSGYQNLEGTSSRDKAENLIKSFKSEQMEKKIIGYKLIKPEYEKAAHALMNHTGFYKDGKVDIRLEDTINIFKKVGVLDLWFEPILEPEFKVGDWVVFETERVKEEYPNLYTGTWNKDHILKIDEIEDDHFRFYNQIGKSKISNSSKCFRKATPEEIKKAQVPDITINGYKAEFFDDYVKFGCACIAKIQIGLALDLINYNSSYTNRTVNSITIGSGTFTSNQIKQIAEYYENN